MEEIELKDSEISSLITGVKVPEAVQQLHSIWLLVKLLRQENNVFFFRRPTLYPLQGFGRGTGVCPTSLLMFCGSGKDLWLSPSRVSCGVCPGNTGQMTCCVGGLGCYSEAKLIFVVKRELSQKPTFQRWPMVMKKWDCTSEQNEFPSESAWALL